MTTLPPEYARILEELGRAHEPSADDQARVFAAVSTATATAAVVGATLSPGAAQAAAPLAKSWALGALKVGGAAKLGVGVLTLAAGAGLWIATTAPAPRHVAQPGAAAHVAGRLPLTEAPAVEAVRPSTNAPPGEPPAQVAQAERAAPAARHTSAPAHASSVSSGSEELTLIGRAQAALRDAAPGRALQLLHEHARRFPHGLLAQERRGLRVLALCADGQHAAGLAARQAFLSEASRSTLGARVEAACSEEP